MVDTAELAVAVTADMSVSETSAVDARRRGEGRESARGCAGGGGGRREVAGESRRRERTSEASVAWRAWLQLGV